MNITNFTKDIQLLCGRFYKTILEDIKKIKRMKQFNVFMGGKTL